jgi:hypothetical protein
MTFKPVTRNMDAAVDLCPKPPTAHAGRGFRRLEATATMQTAVLAPEGVDSLVLASEAAGLCGVAEVTIRRWAHRGYVDRTGTRQTLLVSGKDTRGRNLYRLLDIAKAERATRERARR